MGDEIKDSKWNDNGHIQKGVQGFQNVPDEHKKIAVITTKFTKKQKGYIDHYCKDNKIKVADLMRYTLYKYFESVGEDFSIFDDVIHPNQLNIFESKE